MERPDERHRARGESHTGCARPAREVAPEFLCRYRPLFPDASRSGKRLFPSKKLNVLESRTQATTFRASGAEWSATRAAAHASLIITLLKAGCGHEDVRWVTPVPVVDRIRSRDEVRRADPEAVGLFCPGVEDELSGRPATQGPEPAGLLEASTNRCRCVRI